MRMSEKGTTSCRNGTHLTPDVFGRYISRDDQERQVTVDRQTYSLARNFTVFATQNPVEFEGTYPLPEAQKDRFMLKAWSCCAE